MYQEELRTIEEISSRDTKQGAVKDAENSFENLIMRPRAPPLTFGTSQKIQQGPPAVPQRRRLSQSSVGCSAAGGGLEEGAFSAAKTSEGKSSLEEGRVSKPGINSVELLKDDKVEETLAKSKGQSSTFSPALPRADGKPRVLPSSGGPSTDKWEVPRGKLYVRDSLGVGAFGEVRRAVLEIIGGKSENMMAAVKILKGTAFTLLFQFRI